MNSRIILSTADFSANNIGRYIEMNDLTRKVLAKQTQYGEDSAEAIALNVFLNNLIADGFIGGDNPTLTYLAIPALAKTHSELLYNIARLDENGYPTDSMSDAEKSAETKAYSLYTVNNVNLGLVLGNYIEDYTTQKEQGSYDTHLFDGVSEGSVMPSFSVFGYVPRAFDAATAADTTILRGINNTYRFTLAVDSAYVMKYSTDRLDVAFSEKFKKGFYGFTYIKETSLSGIIDGVTLGEQVITGSLSNITLPANGSKFYSYANNAWNPGRNPSFSVIAYGHAIENNQLTTLKGYVDSLMVALHVKQ